MAGSGRHHRRSKPKPARARDLGIPFDGTPGPLNAITDVAGVEVGHHTLISGKSVRTGVTALLPRGRSSAEPAFAAWFSQNGNGEMTGTAWIEESGVLDSPVMLTNTNSVGVVRDAVAAWEIERSVGRRLWVLPVVAETWDGWLNDINGFHVKAQHARAALERARPGPIAEGNVGGGTGMMGYEFKGGIGTSSRRLKRAHGGYTLGALVQLNCGLRPQLTIAGVSVGRHLTAERIMPSESGSIIIVIATDAPLIPTQLKRLARRATMGLARTGSVSGNGSGDIFIAFSTAPISAPKKKSASPRLIEVRMLRNEMIDPLFAATVEATEEAIINALVAAQTMTGAGGRRLVAIPHEELKRTLERYGRLPAG
jgi:L-aminopeptidase/D-esterase-like protein